MLFTGGKRSFSRRKATNGVCLPGHLLASPLQRCGRPRPLTRLVLTPRAYRFARGEALERSQLQPTELPDEWQDDEVAAAMAAAHDVINRGETETETRRRVLNARNCFLEAAALYKESLEKWKDPRTFRVLSLTLLSRSLSLSA